MNTPDNPIIPKSKKLLKLETIFSIAFHEKTKLDDFLSFNIKGEYKKLEYNGRIIYQPSTKLKSYHKFINDFILFHLNINKEVVYSYRKGSSTYEAVKKHSDKKWFFNTDINNFFSSITKNFAREVLENNTSAIPILDIQEYYDKILEFIIVDDILPIGFSTSPAFSNACLYKFDNNIQDYCSERNLIYTRYSDDIIISSDDKEIIHSIYTTISSFLRKENNGNFSLNKYKTKIVNKGSKVKLLGMVVLPSGKVTVDIKIKKKIEHLIYFYITDKDKFKDAVGKDVDKGIEMISGNLNHINTIDKNYLNKLRKKYGNVIIDMFFHKNVF